MLLFLRQNTILCKITRGIAAGKGGGDATTSENRTGSTGCKIAATAGGKIAAAAGGKIAAATGGKIAAAGGAVLFRSK